MLSWGILLVALTAHVRASAQDTLEQVPTLLLDAAASAGKSTDPAGKDAVVNWKLTCQQLCREGYGGPACGLACLGKNASGKASKLNLTGEAHDAVCPTLCENGLGSMRCKCNRSSTVPPGHDHGAVCKVFCGATGMRLDGCSSCDDDNHLIGPDAASDVRTTTPNWDELCMVWCKMGEGGTVCNCDLPPFI